jgi:hypothetical protein
MFTYALEIDASFIFIEGADKLMCPTYPTQALLV